MTIRIGLVFAALLVVGLITAAVLYRRARSTSDDIVEWSDGGEAASAAAKETAETAAEETAQPAAEPAPV
jgi:hypothetical protein